MLEIVLHGEKIFEVFGFPVTNTILLSWVATAFLILGAFLLGKKTALVPGRLQGVIEIAVGGFYDFMNGILGDAKQSRKHFALVATIFFFVLANNWIALLPGLSAVGINEQTAHGEIFVPLFRTANSDLNMTLIIAIAAIFMVQVIGITTLGFFKYAKKFFNFTSPIDFFIGILELVSEIAKMISFSFRLFGNIFAGEVLLMIIAYLLPYGAPLPFLLLELFVGFIQALVFATLTLVFIQIATVDHH